MITLRQYIPLGSLSVAKTIKKHEEIGSNACKRVNDNIPEIEASFIADDLGLIIFLRRNAAGSIAASDVVRAFAQLDHYFSSIGVYDFLKVLI